MRFRVVEAKDGELLDRTLYFRYQIICEELKALDPAEYCDKRESDKYDEYSKHFVVLDLDSNIAGYVRLISGSPIGYPTENNLKFDIDKEIFDRDKLGELSRIFIAKKYRNLKDTKLIIKTLLHSVYGEFKRSGIEYTYGALEKSMIRLLSMYKANYKTIGESQEYIAAMRHPVVLYTEELGRDNNYFKD